MTNKRYYWFKFKEDFFSNDSVMYLEELENGSNCIVFFLKVCLANINGEGQLVRKVGKKYIPHNDASLSKVTRTDIEEVKEYLNLLIEVGLIEVLEDGIMFIPTLKDAVGSESDSAKRMRKLREKKKQQEELNTNNNKILDKDKDIDIDIEVTSQCDAHSKKPYGKYGNVLLSDKEYSELLEAHRQHKLELCIKVLDEYIESTGKEYNNHTPVINGWVIDTVNKGIKEGKYPKEEVNQEGLNDFLKTFGTQLEEYLENPF